MRTEIAVARRCGQAPLLASKSNGWQIPKDVGDTGKSGTDAVRIVHGFCDFWKNMYRGLHAAGKQWEGPDYLYGFRRGRRREAAMAVPRILGERARAEGKSCIDMSTDMSNAFGCSKHEHLDELEAARLRQEGVELFKARRAVFIWDCYLRRGPERRHGGKAEEACEDFQAAVNECSGHPPAADPRTYVQCPFGGGLFDASIVVYADDIWKKLLVDAEPGKALHAVALSKIESCNVRLDQVLGKRDYAHNISKQVVIPDLRENAANRDICMAEVKYKIRGMHRHLGGCYTTLPSNVRDIEKRVQAGNRGWVEGAGFWHRDGVSWGVRRT